jgi:hypothetical protein
VDRRLDFHRARALALEPEQRLALQVLRLVLRRLRLGLVRWVRLDVGLCLRPVLDSLSTRV